MERRRDRAEREERCGQRKELRKHQHLKNPVEKEKLFFFFKKDSALKEQHKPKR